VDVILNPFGLWLAKSRAVEKRWNVPANSHWDTLE